MASMLGELNLHGCNLFYDLYSEYSVAYSQVHSLSSYEDPTSEAVSCGPWSVAARGLNAAKCVHTSHTTTESLPVQMCLVLLCYLAMCHSCVLDDLEYTRLPEHGRTMLQYKYCDPSQVVVSLFSSSSILYIALQSTSPFIHWLYTITIALERIPAF